MQPLIEREIDSRWTLLQSLRIWHDGKCTQNVNYKFCHKGNHNDIFCYNNSRERSQNVTGSDTAASVDVISGLDLMIGYDFCEDFIGGLVKHDNINMFQIPGGYIPFGKIPPRFFDNSKSPCQTDVFICRLTAKDSPINVMDIAEENDEPIHKLWELESIGTDPAAPAIEDESNISILGWGALIEALAGGISWLMLWHKLHRHFFSALLIIMLNVIFVGMVVTYFLKYAVNPNTYLAAFVVFPVCFDIAIIAYFVAYIKRVHIFSCSLLSLYAFVVPFAFYFGSSWTYMAINFIGLITANRYPDTLEYPPFQVCDIVLLFLWLALFTSRMVYQLHQERSGQPFHPPSRASWMATMKVVNFIFYNIFSCLPMDPDHGGVGIEDHPT
ncbi:hypothetical protein SK128_000886 [Halocaridina rubra]|uniref:TM7S3/TM198-like domain-containing protein n=1 Tax=Halocaridina rubra TaxID=373956 RepID=A0AAN9A7P8_HALRR